MWRDTGLRAECFYGLDGRVALFLLMLILHISWATLYAFIGVALFFFLLQRAGFTFATMMSRVRLILLGNERPASSLREFYLRRMADDDGKEYIL